VQSLAAAAESPYAWPISRPNSFPVHESCRSDAGHREDTCRCARSPQRLGTRNRRRLLAVDLPVSDEMPLPAGCSKIAYIALRRSRRPGLGASADWIVAAEATQAFRFIIWPHPARSPRGSKSLPRSKISDGAEQDATVHIGAKIPFSLPSACTMREKKSVPQRHSICAITNIRSVNRGCR